MKQSSKALLAGAALAGLFSGTMTARAAMTTTSAKGTGISAGQSAVTMADKEDKHACKGQNACKGKGGCKSGDNGCKGKNSCKGKGGCATDGSHKKKE